MKPTDSRASECLDQPNAFSASDIPRAMRVPVPNCLRFHPQQCRPPITPLSTAQAPDTFRWIDFHAAKRSGRGGVGDAPSTAKSGRRSARSVCNTTRHSLPRRPRATPQSATNRDTFSIWSVSLSDRALTHIADVGENLRLVDWLLLNAGQGRELGALYDDCTDCQATTYFTALRYDLRQHIWAARWMQGGQERMRWR